MPSSIAAQLFTLRDFCKTPADIAKTMKRVREIGYEAVQLSALGPIDAKELAKVLKGEGLAVAATHAGFDRLRDHSAVVIEEHAIWDCHYTAIGGWFPPADIADPAPAWTKFAADFSDVAKKYAGSDLKIGYHNHSHELVRLGKQTPLGILIEKAVPAVWFEIDTYWITHGGGDPIQWINKLNGRLPCVHLKDMGITVKREQLMQPVGEGNLNFGGILDACRSAGTEWFIVEQDNCNGLDPFECLATSLRNLRSLGLS